MKKIVFACIILFVVSACSSSKKILYFQDTQNAAITKNINHSPIRLQPEDKVSILVNSKDAQLTNLFNLAYVTTRLGQTNASLNTNTTQGVSGYTIDSAGNIDFPVLGTLHIGGMTRMEVASFVKNKLISENLVKDPIVTVEYMNLQISILGEVSKPGRYNIVQDKITILEALSMAGDMSIYGKRENVRVIRNENGVQKTYTINLCSATEVFDSPVYYLQQNDVVYVEPNSMRTRQSTVNGNNIRSANFWTSMVSVFVTVAIFCINYL
ncbi:MAG: polysaccharide biosynthesis/export family protein [Bacteroidales bacterium]|nr:polysaccharide biosynthesis/export family protein [Bacteroidales bacterium]